MYYYLLLSSTFDDTFFVKTAPIGQFGWQSFSLTRYKNNKYDAFFKEIEALKDNSPQIKAGMFEGSYAKYNEVLTAVNEIENRARAYMY